MLKKNSSTFKDQLVFGDFHGLDFAEKITRISRTRGNPVQRKSTKIEDLKQSMSRCCTACSPTRCQ